MRVRNLTVAVAAGATLVIATACSAPDETAERSTATQTMTETVEVTETANEEALAPTPERRSPVRTETPPPTTSQVAIMPNVVCLNLQDAQNAIQAAGVFFSRSSDATGRDRSQLVDRNWIVVGQNPSPGTPFGEGEAVLSAVKIGEPNNC